MSEKMCAAPFSSLFFPGNIKTPAPPQKKEEREKIYKRQKKEKPPQYRTLKEEVGLSYSSTPTPSFPLSLSTKKHRFNCVACTVHSVSVSLSLARSLAAKSLTTIKTNQHISKNSQPTRVSRLNTKVRGGEIIQDE